MPRGVGGGGGGGGGGYRSGSGGYKSSSKPSSSSKSSSSGGKSYKVNAKDPNAPNEVRVRSAGGLYKTFSYSDVVTDEFQNEYVLHYEPFPHCKSLLGTAIEDTLCQGSDGYYSQLFRRLLEEHCGISLEFDSKKGSTSTSSAPN